MYFILAEYIEPLMNEVQKLRECYPTYKDANHITEMAPPSITDTLDKTPKSVLVNRHSKRFNLET